MSADTHPVLAVIGAGAAGMMAACAAAEKGADVIIVERNKIAGKKLRITGKGRCNLTNNCEPREFLTSVMQGASFLYSALFRFSPEDTMNYFEALGVALKTERGRRVFPVSDRAADVAAALEKQLRSSGVRFFRGRAAEIIYEDGRVCGVKTESGTVDCAAVIVACGGISYPATGSDGDGYRFARDAGLELTPPEPSLVPVVTREDTSPMMGLSLKNCELSVFCGEKRIFRERGEMLFTHFGISGPLTLSASAHMRRGELSSCRIEIDLKPALTEGELDTRIISDFGKFNRRDLVNALGELLPQKIISPMIAAAGLDPRIKISSVTREMRTALVTAIKHFPLTPVSFRSTAEAIVTRGGVKTTCLDPRTMMAKAAPGLFFAGEVIDADAYTGGYNLQIAWSTGRLAGEAAADFIYNLNS